jgi:Fe2+ or Zn2+ uptake regulation protein
VKQTTKHKGVAGNVDNIRDIAMDIMRYLNEHPRSKDTLEGIRMWWLENESVPIPASHVEKALEWLLQQGVVEKQLLPDEGAVYAAKQDKSISWRISH